jgi:hypothetical protein
MNNNDLLTCFILFVFVYQIRENICGGNRLVEGLKCINTRGCRDQGYHHCAIIGGVGHCISNADADAQEVPVYRPNAEEDSALTKWCTIM